VMDQGGLKALLYINSIMKSITTLIF